MTDETKITTDALDVIARLTRERDEARALLQATANDNARLAAIVEQLDRAQFDRWCATRQPSYRDDFSRANDPFPKSE